MMKLVKTILLTASILATSAAYANGPSLTKTSGITKIMWCCGVKQVTLSNTVRDDTSRTPSSYNTDDCTTNAAPADNDGHTGIANAISTGSYVYDGPNNMDVGSDCKQIIVHRHCEWAASTSTICLADEQNNPIAAGGLNPGT